MKYLKLISLLCIAAIGSLFTSCEETAAVDEYANWQERNTAYIDSIAKVAEENADGKWLKLLAFGLNETDINGIVATYGNEDYVYCHIKQSGEGTEYPLRTVQANYRGRLIPTDSHPEGYVFDQSYKDAFNPATIIPTELRVNELISGWQTALKYMKKGDRWIIYIPANLGYQSKSQTNIPAHSALIFDMHVTDCE